MLPFLVLDLGLDVVNGGLKHEGDRLYKIQPVAAFDCPIVRRIAAMCNRGASNMVQLWL
jgi:hypothetical protein